MVRVLALLLLISSASNVLCQQQDQAPAIENGCVTRTVSLADFDVNGFHVVAGKKTTFWINYSGGLRHQATTDPYLGQSVTIYGELNEKKREVSATNVVFHPLNTTTLSGFALVEHVLSPTLPGKLLLRADGYVILINPETKTSFQKPLGAINDITTGIWIKYHGKPQSDGIVLADTAGFVENSVVDKEAKLLDKTDYDPASVDLDSKQSTASKLFLGRNPKKIPPYKDAALQARVDRIGTSLIPPYQKKMPESDLSKVIFRFQLIDDPKMKDALALPSGVILIPFQIVNSLKDDSQLATVLADNLACTLEKQTYRAKPGQTKMTVAQIASAAGGITLFGPATIASSVVAASDKRNAEDQSGRVSLGLLHDAGYDINQAPIAWWLLAAKSKQDIQETSLPPRAANLYKSIGSTWRNYPETTSPPPSLQTKQ